MFSRMWVGLRLLLVALVFAAVTSTAAPAASPSRVIAIGDLHGDYSAWRDIARAARLMDESGRWAGGATLLVQLGDVADRGADTRQIIRDLMRLQKEAPRSGGRVVALVGNHEAMNITGDLRYVSAGEFESFADSKSDRRRNQVFEENRSAIEEAYRKINPAMEREAIRQAWLLTMPPGMLEHQAAWHPKGEIGRWVIGNPAIALIDGTLFVHAGISAAYASLPIAEINRAVAAALKARETSDASFINDPIGPLWYRGLARSSTGKSTDRQMDAAPAVARDVPTLSVEAELDLVLRAYGAQRMVIAHTPNLSGIMLLHGGRLVRIDTGISSAYGGTPSYLEILDGRLIPHAVPRSAPTMSAPTMSAPGKSVPGKENRK